jgi:hypothetical protein
MRDHQRHELFLFGTTIGRPQRGCQPQCGHGQASGAPIRVIGPIEIRPIFQAQENEHRSWLVGRADPRSGAVPEEPGCGSKS